MGRWPSSIAGATTAAETVQAALSSTSPRRSGGVPAGSNAPPTPTSTFCDCFSLRRANTKACPPKLSGIASPTSTDSHNSISHRHFACNPTTGSKTMILSVVGDDEGPLTMKVRCGDEGPLWPRRCAIRDRNHGAHTEASRSGGNLIARPHPRWKWRDPPIGNGVICFIPTRKVGQVRTKLASLSLAATLCVAFLTLASTSTAGASPPSTPLTLVNGWKAAPFATRAPAASLISGVVHLKGAMDTAGTNHNAFHIAGDHAASQQEAYVPVDLCNATNGRLDVAPTGKVTVEAEGGTFA